jgi:hypothetical protein
MWQWIIKRRLAEKVALSTPISPAEFKQATCVVFPVFARYGDSVIAFKAINEFIAAHPEKHYTIITTHQALPYARELITGAARVQFFAVNKRRNPLRMWRLSSMLRRDPPDIGLNPWSHGEESEYFASFAKRFFLYRTFANFSREENLYRRARDYLSLPRRVMPIAGFTLAQARRVVIVPFSTDVRKSLSADDLTVLLRQVRERFKPQSVTIAAFDDELARINDATIESFVFRKSQQSSEDFLALLRATDLFIGVDAGPLHLASAMNIPSIGIFGPTAVETILDYAGSGVRPLRTATLDGVFCDVLSCREPVCIHQLQTQLDFDKPIQVDFTKRPQLEVRVCRAVDQDDAAIPPAKTPP